MSVIGLLFGFEVSIWTSHNHQLLFHQAGFLFQNANHMNTVSEKREAVCVYSECWKFSSLVYVVRENTASLLLDVSHVLMNVLVSMRRDFNSSFTSLMTNSSTNDQQQYFWHHKWPTCYTFDIINGQHYCSWYHQWPILMFCMLLMTHISTSDITSDQYLILLMSQIINISAFDVTNDQY